MQDCLGGFQKVLGSKGGEISFFRSLSCLSAVDQRVPRFVCLAFSISLFLSLCLSFSVRQFRSLIANCLGCVFCLPFYCHSRAGEIGCQQTTPLCQLLHSPAFVSVAVFSLSLHCCLFFIAFPIPLYSLAHAIIMQIKSFPSLYLDDLRPCLHRSDRRRRCRFSIATKCDNILTANCSAFFESCTFSVSGVGNLQRPESVAGSKFRTPISMQMLCTRFGTHLSFSGSKLFLLLK